MIPTIAAILSGVGIGAYLVASYRLDKREGFRK